MVRRVSFCSAVFLACALAANAATVQGVVKEGDSTGAAISQAIVTLTTTGVGAQTLTDTTDTTGAFSFTTVGISAPRIRASKTGYQTMQQVTVQVTDSTATYTQNLFLISTSFRATISGTITDSATTTAISGAVVILSRTAGAGVGPDTVKTGSSGAYSFDSLASGTYSIRISASGYVTRTANLTITSASLTDNIKLVAVVYGSVAGVISDSSTAAAISGAMVILTRTGGVGVKPDTIKTGATGAYAFDSLATGTYSARVSATGYVTRTVSVPITSATPLALNIKLNIVEFGSILGVIADSADSKGISGAKVLLRRGGTTADSAVTGSDGAYSFAKVTSGSSYSITASATGYVSRSSATIALTGTRTDTLNLKLNAITYGKITGKVTADSLRGAALSGVKVLLSPRNGGGVLDSATSDTNGVYLFGKVQSGQNYSIAASLTGYASATANHNNQTSGTDTVNIALTKIGAGSLYVKVLKRSDSTAISAASVVATQTGGAGGLTFSGTTSSTGEVAFENFVISGNTLGFSITASASDYTAGAGTASVPKNGKDTVTIYLAASANGAKLITGTVKDSSSKSLLAHVRITVTVTGTGIGGQTLTFIDSTGTDGKYAIGGIPLTATTVNLSATLTGYRTFTRNNLSVGAANKADTTTLDIAILEATAIGSPSGVSRAAAMPAIMVTSNNAIRLTNITQNGIVTIVGMSGRLLLRHSISAHESIVNLPVSLAKSGSAFIVTMTQGRSIYRQRIIMP